MRWTVQELQKLVPIPDEHLHVGELAQLSMGLDEHPKIYDLVHATRKCARRETESACCLGRSDLLPEIDRLTIIYRCVVRISR